MSRPLRASILAVALVLLGAAVASGCSYVDPPVLSMSATTSDAPYYTLTREQMYDELAKEATNTSTTVKAYDTKDTAAYLNKKVNVEFLKHFMDEKKIVVSDADTTRAQQAASSSGSTTAPDPEQLKTQAELIAIYRSLANSAYESGTVDKDKELRGFYDANKAQIETPAGVCLHVIALQAGTGAAPPTEADFAAALAKATQVRTRLDTESFETVADAEAAAQGGQQQGSPGGDVGCIEAANLGDVQAAVEALPINVISQPIRTERGGFYVVRVDRKVPASLPTFDEVKDRIEVEVSQELGKKLLPAVAGDVIKRTNVRIDPRFGAWDAAQFTVTQPPPAATPTMPTTTVAPGAGLPLGGGADPGADPGANPGANPGGRAPAAANTP